mmetsp:Transcript_6474/g.29207  ORF Transcript_6474/g.29207 Transcript_6474/m.29207 type:complete len:358 (-) Transcript_6474:390-1463(-)
MAPLEDPHDCVLEVVVQKVVERVRHEQIRALAKRPRLEHLGRDGFVFTPDERGDHVDNLDASHAQRRGDRAPRRSLRAGVARTLELRDERAEVVDARLERLGRRVPRRRSARASLRGEHGAHRLHRSTRRALPVDDGDGDVEHVDERRGRRAVVRGDARAVGVAAAARRSVSVPRAASPARSQSPVEELGHRIFPRELRRQGARRAARDADEDLRRVRLPRGPRRRSLFRRFLRFPRVGRVRVDVECFQEPIEQRGVAQPRALIPPRAHRGQQHALHRHHAPRVIGAHEPQEHLRHRQRSHVFHQSVHEPRIGLEPSDALRRSSAHQARHRLAEVPREHAVQPRAGRDVDEGHDAGE